MQKAELYAKIEEVSKTIFSYCMAKTATREEAEDLSQDILYELIKSSDSIRDDNAFYAFMWGVAGNIYKQWCRKKRKHRMASYELPEEIPAEEEPAEEENENVFLLRRELTLLSEKYRRATILYYVEGRSCLAIASELGISESMVKYLLFKSRKIMKEGMHMERTLGELSYHPKSLTPMYSGQGPNCFWQFMQSKIRQNIVSACYNDSLTAQQISLETGIPLPYLEDEIRELEEKQIILKVGKHDQANVIVITSACSDEMARAFASDSEKIADKMERFLNTTWRKYKEIGFRNCDFSENTLRWQLAVILFKVLGGFDSVDCDVIANAPKTGWGEAAYLWCVEQPNETQRFNDCSMDSKYGDRLHFFDDTRDGNGKGDHHDFYGNARYINLFCDICRGEPLRFSEYDLEVVAELIKKGYVVKENDSYRATVPVYTAAQYNAMVSIVNEFITNELAAVVKTIEKTAIRILSAHTPKHLQKQVAGIVSMDTLFIHAICKPAAILIDRQVLRTAWHPLEMPTTYVVLRP